MTSHDHHLIHKPDEEGLGDLSVDRLVTVPNVITTIRLGCIPLFLWLLFAKDSPGWAGFVLGSLGATDWVDGYIARRFNQTSNFGKMYDPTVDRLMMVVGIVAIIVDGRAPLWFAWMVLVREVLLSMWVVGITALGAKRMDVTWWGKCGTFANMGAFPSFLIAAQRSLGDAWHTGWTIAAYVFMIPGVIFSMLAAGQYVVRGREALAEGRAERAHAAA
ncbi:MAG: CDP-alcohol phosphatidyltransferase family protein [Acidimicrobiales bacterium]